MLGYRLHRVTFKALEGRRLSREWKSSVYPLTSAASLYFKEK